MYKLLSSFTIQLVALMLLSCTSFAQEQQPPNHSIGDYLLRDNISHTLVVSKEGDGDYTTISQAFQSITNSSFNNQYEVLVRPGKYKESGLTLPPFTHLKGIGGVHEVTIYDDKVRAPWIVDQRYSSKMSNLVLDILNSEAYVIHYDAPSLTNAVTVNRNLKIIHRGGDIGAAVIGGGSWDNYISLWQDCFFLGEKGQPACHTKQNSRNAMDLRFVNCSFSSGFSIGAVGGYEPSKITFQGCTFMEPCRAFISLIKNEPELWKYPANNLEWIISGANNKGFILDISGTRNKGECVVAEAKTVEKNVSISGSAAALLFGTHTHVTTSNKRIKGKVRGSADVRDVQSGLLPYSTPIDVIQLWKRLGDCTLERKELIITTGDKTETINFTKNYLKNKMPEKAILREINNTLKEAFLYKDSGVDIYDVIDMPEKILVLAGSDEGIIKNEFVTIKNYRALRATATTPLYRVAGIAVSEATKDQPVKVWKGSFIVDLPDGEYGISNDLQLSRQAPIKLGKVSGNVFQPFY